MTTVGQPRTGRGRGTGTSTGPGTATGTGTGTMGPAVLCEELVYRFGEHVAVNDADLEIRHGETFGLLGPNGAGKTTTIRMLTTLLKPASGRVLVFGVDAAARPMLVRRMIGYVGADRGSGRGGGRDSLKRDSLKGDNGRRKIRRRRRSKAGRGRGHRVLSTHRADGGTARRGAAA
jgi:ABC-type phosphonate transport system ATPase subunit